MSKKKILMVSQYYPPDVTAAAFRISETASILRENGFDVKVLTARPHRVQVEDAQSVNESDVIRAPILKMKTNSIKGYLSHYLSFMFSSFIWGLFKVRGKVDYVIASSPPLFVALAGWLLARLKGSRYILDIRDIWPDSATGTGHLRQNSFSYRLAKILEGFIYRRADMITCVSERMKGYIRSRTEKKTDIIVLYNGLSRGVLENSKAGSDRDFREGDELIISYIGNIGYAQNLDLLIDAAGRFHNGQIKFALIGEGARKETLLDKTRSAGLKNVIFKGPCSRLGAFECMNGADALIIILKRNNTAFELTIPSKVFDYLWANKPILYGIEGEGKEVLGSLPGNLYFDSSDSLSLVRAAEKLRNNYDLYKQKALKNRDFVLGRFTRESMVKKLEECLV